MPVRIWSRLSVFHPSRFTGGYRTIRARGWPSSRAMSESPLAPGPNVVPGHQPKAPSKSSLVTHVPYKLPSRHYKSAGFAKTVLDLIQRLNIPSWATVLSPEIPSSALNIRKVSGSHTNAVFFVTYPPDPSSKTLLLRIYGPSSSEFICRSQELHVLGILSSRYQMGPRLYGTFKNGRVEEHFDSVTLTSSDVRDPTISRWIGATMAELHLVDLDAVQSGDDKSNASSSGNVAVLNSVTTWIPRASSVLDLPEMYNRVREVLRFKEFISQWDRYVHWVIDWERKNGMSQRVFSHNDAHHMNLLRLSKKGENLPDHRQILIVDFEYSTPNPAAFDIANHFIEWTADYHSASPHMLSPSLYPNRYERRNFYRSYLTRLQGTQTVLTPLETPTVDIEFQMDILDHQVRAWTPASLAMWGVWGIVQARETVQKGPTGEQGEMDYLGYAMCRLEGFRREVKLLGV